MAYIGLERMVGKGGASDLDAHAGDKFIISPKEFTQEFYDHEPGPIRMKVIEHDPDGPGYRWMMKEGVDMLRSFRDGDEITITKAMEFDLVKSAVKFSGAVGKFLRWQQTVSYGIRFAAGTKIKFVSERMDRFRVFLCMAFDGDPDGMRNLDIPKLAGFCFTEPDSPELGILDAPEEILNDRELVVKGIMQYYDCSEDRANAELVVVEKAMAKYGICFYRP
jgi:hypothetical protein